MRDKYLEGQPMRHLDGEEPHTDGRYFGSGFDFPDDASDLDLGTEAEFDPNEIEEALKERRRQGRH